MIGFACHASPTSLLHQRATPRLHRRRTRRHTVTSCTKLNSRFVDLSTGVQIEVITGTPPNAATNKPPLLFVHGSFHGAWCWHLYQQYFAALGYVTYAVSLRGAGKSSTGNSEGKVYLHEVLDDLDAVYDALCTVPPVVVGHSTGGLLVQQWAARSAANAAKFAAAVLCCSKPPSRFNAMTWRITRRYGVGFAWRMAMGFIQNRFATDLDLCREVFFTAKDGPGYAEEYEGDEKLLEYMHKFGTMSRLAVDLKSTQVPISHPGILNGRTLVVGGEYDRTVDVGTLKQTAEFYGGEELVLPTPHDIMLCSQWRLSADAIADWLDEKFPSTQGMPFSTVTQIEH